MSHNVTVPFTNTGITELCDKTETELSEEARASMIFLTGTAMSVFVVGSAMHHKNLNWVPESLVVVCMGCLLGAILWAAPVYGRSFYLNEAATSLMFGAMLKLFALPIIIFESGWSLRLRDFISQLGYIMLFAIVGTTVSVIVVAQLILQTSNLHGITQTRTALAYASLISSVDPVATLATFGALNVDPLLFILVFGESQINDAVAITLFESLNAHPLSAWSELILKMMQLLFGSIALGLALACVYVLLLRLGRMGHSAPQAILFILCSCFFTYSFAEQMRLSGIITVLFNSILMGALAPAHLSAEGTSLCSFVLKQMASLADTSIFVLSGVIVVFVITSGGKGVHFGLYMSGFCLVARFCAIVPLGLLSNAVKYGVSKKLPAERKHIITWKHFLMMWHSGLRGGVSLVLALELGPWVDPDTKQTLVNGTFVLIVLYLLVFGSTTGPCLRCLGLPIGDQVIPGQMLYDQADKDGWGWRALMKLRKKVLVPCLVGRHIADYHGKLQPMGEVLREAEAAENRSDFGSPNHLQRYQSCKTARGNTQVYAYFGTTDPAHVEAIEDIVSDLHHQDVVTDGHAALKSDSDESDEEASSEPLE